MTWVRIFAGMLLVCWMSGAAQAERWSTDEDRWLGIAVDLPRESFPYDMSPLTRWPGAIWISTDGQSSVSTSSLEVSASYASSLRATVLRNDRNRGIATTEVGGRNGWLEFESIEEGKVVRKLVKVAPNCGKRIVNFVTVRFPQGQRAKYEPLLDRIFDSAKTISSTLCESRIWMQIGSRKTIEEAKAFAEPYADSYPELSIFKAQNGWHAIVVRSVAPDRVEEALRRMKANGSIPQDGLSTFGHSFVNRAWKPKSKDTAPKVAGDDANSSGPSNGSTTPGLKGRTDVPTRQDLFAYVGMTMTCEFDTGLFEGEITELRPSVPSLNHGYDFKYKYRIMIDHRGRQYRMPLAEGSRAVRSFDRAWLNRNCYSSMEDWNVLIDLWGRDGVSNGDLVDCEGIKGTIARLRKENIVLLANEYLFDQSKCTVLQKAKPAKADGAEAPAKADDLPEEVAPEPAEEILDRVKGIEGIDDPSEAKAECDRLAAQTYDKDHDLPGVSLAELKKHVEEARAACEKAVEDGEGRYLYQLGRVFYALDKTDESLDLIERAAKAGHGLLRAILDGTVDAYRSGSAN